MKERPMLFVGDMDGATQIRIEINHVPANGDNVTCPYKLGDALLRIKEKRAIEITNIRSERLHDITEQDARRCGVTYNRNPAAVSLPGADTAREAFASLWKRINGAEAWDANPWVWVIDFRTI